MVAYAELAVTTNFTFLHGASHPEEMVAQAHALGLAGLGIADRNSVAGVVRAHVYARENKLGLHVAPGARLVFSDCAPDVLAFPQDRAAWGRLCRLLTIGNMRAQKGECILFFDDLEDWHEGLQFIVMEGDANEAAFVRRLKTLAPRRVWIGAKLDYGPRQRERLASRVALARDCALPLVAINDALMHEPARRDLAGALACVREGVQIAQAGAKFLHANAERHLKSGAEMARIFTEAPQAVGESVRFLAGLKFSLDQLRYEYPSELREGFSSEQEALTAFAWEGARNRYPAGVPDNVSAAIIYELAIVAQLEYAAYFLTVHDIVRFARGRGILCQGRGSAANSAVCFCLGITEVDPTKHDLLFERFMSPERREPPDIDVDFEHERREEVMQYIYAHYGRERAGLTASVTTYRSRSALREIGKVFGFAEETLAAMSSTIWGGSSEAGAAAQSAGLDSQNQNVAHMMRLAQEIAGFPRHLSQHTGGFVITQSRLDEVVPIAPAAMDRRTTIVWDKNDLDALGILKIDVLALGMLSCLRRGFDLLESHYGQSLTLASLPAEEPCVYDMICRADTIGVFQIESRAQMSMLPRLRPRAFYDLVIEVAIVRPGPIQGDMVHPYLRRRQGLEQVRYPSKELEEVLGKTLGVPLFQEQAMKIAIVAAGFTPSEADKLRRAMATFKRVGTIHTFRIKMIEGMAARGYDRAFAERCFAQIEGFGTYGFPESHAASFALLVYASCWFKCRYPDVFACALLNSQPMGFYAPAQIVRDAREHGTCVREVDVNASDWDCSLENAQGHERRIVRRHGEQAPHIRGDRAVRLGFRMIAGLREADMRKLVELRGRGYDSVRDVWLRTGLSPAVLEKLCGADSFRSIGLDRRQALWAVRGLNRAGDKDDLALWRYVALNEIEPDAHLPPMPLGEHVVEDYRSLSLSLKAHPVSFLRNILAQRRFVRSADLANLRGKKPRVTISGLVLVRQRPGSARGVVFMTLEDEAGVANIIVWPDVFEANRAIVIGARFVAITGRVQNEGGVIHIVAESLQDLSPMLGQLSAQGASLSSLARADEVRRPLARDPRETGTTREPVAVMPKGRNFH
jgi:error-prone DNA polymerase